MPKKDQTSWSKIKLMAILFFGGKNIVHHEFPTSGKQNEDFDRPEGCCG